MRDFTDVYPSRIYDHDRETFLDVLRVIELDGGEVIITTRRSHDQRSEICGGNKRR